MSEKYFWLIEKIIDSDEIELTKLVYCITGKKTLSFGDQIFVQRSEVPDQFSFISCRNTLVLPFAPMSKKNVFCIFRCLQQFGFQS
jgi:hypothetical protein